MIAAGTAQWSGSWKEGRGSLSTGTDTLADVPYDFASRFEGADGAIPEELLAVAYAGCLNQAFANVFGWGNFTAEFIETTVDVDNELSLDITQAGPITITMRAKVPGIEPGQFQGLAITAARGCLISRFLKVEPKMTFTLVD
ncbi:OsmC family peroxiredoxin [Curtobacterium sp. MCLR17_040]|uniref:OsmC family peroxiredoxin n=1 Tax=Curtobacterium sp. MCLR17_040 TaxID=2175625 RepID=UPI000DA854E9|nr:OsmC family peroxiredoxin [Curtobacterium sp. MCLR17_040]PZF00261.1 OsmC family peroxiredoxin [Curtobacterium sp. MCLR17_040]